MKPNLQLKIGQSLTMTPQLQQAIKLLQLSTLDLQQEIQEALDSNPLLETTDEPATTPKSDEADKESLDFSQPEADQPKASEEADIRLDNEPEIPKDLPVDSGWDEIYPNQPSQMSSGGASDEINFDEKNTANETLHDQLTWQLNLTRFTEKEQIIATTIIDAIDTRGYLTQDLETLHLTAQQEWTALIKNDRDSNKSAPHDHTHQDQDQPIEPPLAPALSTLEGAVEEEEEDQETIYKTIYLEDVRITLVRIQQFDPPGVGAKNSEECLLIQLNQLPDTTPFLEEAKLLLSSHSKLLSKKDFNQLIKKTKFSKQKLSAALSLIKQLNPYPGDQISSTESEYVIPDVIVHKKEERWLVALNPGTTPNLRINSTYASIQSKQASEKGFIKQHLQEAKWFIKSLQNRNETLLKVATKIVEYQLEFFEKGAEYMRPLVLQVIAEAVEMHESTISRVTTQKYMHTPFGIFELKYFFSSHVGTVTGEDCSSTAIKAMIKKFISNEDTKKPLSDSKIAKLLADEGKNVARRTIAKYREAMSIPPSNERKQLE